MIDVKRGMIAKQILPDKNYVLIVNIVLVTILSNPLFTYTGCSRKKAYYYSLLSQLCKQLSDYCA